MEALLPDKDRVSVTPGRAALACLRSGACFMLLTARSTTSNRSSILTGFEKVIVGPEVQALLGYAHGAVAGDHYNLYPEILFLDCLKDPQVVYARHPDVEHTIWYFFSLSRS